ETRQRDASKNVARLREGVAVFPSSGQRGKNKQTTTRTRAAHAAASGGNPKVSAGCSDEPITLRPESARPRIDGRDAAHLPSRVRKTPRSSELAAAKRAVPASG